MNEIEIRASYALQKMDQNFRVIVPTPLVGEGTIYSNGFFFLFSEFWPIDIFVVEKCEWYH